MSVTRRVTFRLYPSTTQERQLFEWKRLHCYLYNACVEHRRTSYQKFGNSINYFDQQNALPAFKECWSEYKKLASHALQATVKRVDFAFTRFFRLKSGYPKFKANRRYKGWTYPCQAGWKACTEGKNGYLKLSNLGNIKMRGKARSWGTPKTCTILFKQEKWYASITIACVPSRIQTDKGAIGLDFGVFQAVADSNGGVIDNPRFIGQAQEKVNRLAKKSRRKRPPNYKKRIRASRRWREANQAVSKLQAKVARQRQDWQHQVATQIVSCNSLVATEKLNLKGMTRKARQGSKRKRQKTGLNRSLLDVGIGNLKSLIQYKVTEAGGFYIEVPTKKLAPSQTCPNCGHRKKKELSERVHSCQKCSYTCDRDVAAAMVMLQYARGQELSSSDVESPTSVSCGSMRKVGALKRQKLVPNL
ncbi:MAG: transposase [Pleurocapsa sp. MO_192.B19]|nr:transposase [Pleurocapsa sp. MO_192.B19]